MIFKYISLLLIIIICIHETDSTPKKSANSVQRTSGYFLSPDGKCRHFYKATAGKVSCKPPKQRAVRVSKRGKLGKVNAKRQHLKKQPGRNLIKKKSKSIGKRQNLKKKTGGGRIIKKKKNVTQNKGKLLKSNSRKSPLTKSTNNNSGKRRGPLRIRKKNTRTKSSQKVNKKVVKKSENAADIEKMLSDQPANSDMGKQDKGTLPAEKGTSVVNNNVNKKSPRRLKTKKKGTKKVKAKKSSKRTVATKKHKKSKPSGSKLIYDPSSKSGKCYTMYKINGVEKPVLKFESDCFSYEYADRNMKKCQRVVTATIAKGQSEAPKDAPLEMCSKQRSSMKIQQVKTNANQAAGTKYVYNPTAGRCVPKKHTFRRITKKNSRAKRMAIQEKHRRQRRSLNRRVFKNGRRQISLKKSPWKRTTIYNSLTECQSSNHQGDDSNAAAPPSKTSDNATTNASQTKAPATGGEKNPNNEVPPPPQPSSNTTTNTSQTKAPVTSDKGDNSKVQSTQQPSNVETTKPPVPPATEAPPTKKDDNPTTPPSQPPNNVTTAQSSITTANEVKPPKLVPAAQVLTCPNKKLILAISEEACAAAGSRCKKIDEKKVEASAKKNDYVGSKYVFNEYPYNVIDDVKCMTVGKDKCLWCSDEDLAKLKVVPAAQVLTCFKQNLIRAISEEACAAAGSRCKKIDVKKVEASAKKNDYVGSKYILNEYPYDVIDDVKCMTVGKDKCLWCSDEDLAKLKVTTLPPTTIPTTTVPPTTESSQEIEECYISRGPKKGLCFDLPTAERVIEQQTVNSGLSNAVKLNSFFNTMMDTSFDDIFRFKNQAQKSMSENGFDVDKLIEAMADLEGTEKCDVIMKTLPINSKIYLDLADECEYDWEN